MGTFSGILGNKPALRLLEGALASGEPSHAYLFYGPLGVGKRTVARRFGAALVAGGDSGAEDRALRRLHPDLSEIEPDGRYTTIDQGREITRQAASRPFEGARRVFVLRADTLNVQAANALLKTLEEPEGGAVFVLLATSREGVLPTIVSRAQAVRFDPVPPAEVVSFLVEQRGHPEGGARLAGALGRGSVGLALRYAEEEEFKELREAVFEAGLLLDHSFEDRHGVVEEIMGKAEAVGAAQERSYLLATSEEANPDRQAKESAKRAGRAARGGAVAEALELLALLYRDAAVVAAGASELAVNVDRVVEIGDLVAKYPEVDWTGVARIFGEEGDKLTYNVSPEAILEVALSQTRRKMSGTYPGW